MTSPRAYQTVRTQRQALAELHRCAGSQFDPAVVAVLDDALHLSSQIEPARRREDALADLIEVDVAEPDAIPSVVTDGHATDGHATTLTV